MIFLLSRGLSFEIRMLSPPLLGLSSWLLLSIHPSHIHFQISISFAGDKIIIIKKQMIYIECQNSIRSFFYVKTNKYLFLLKIFLYNNARCNCCNSADIILAKSINLHLLIDVVIKTPMGKRKV